MLKRVLISLFSCIFLVTETVSADTQTKSGEGLVEAKVNYEYYDNVNFVVTLPKSMVLDKDGVGSYPVKVEGGIAPTRVVNVMPMDKITTEAGINFSLNNEYVNAEPITASVIQNKTVWSSADVAGGVETNDNVVSASSLTMGVWRGSFSFEVSLDGSNDEALSTMTNVVDGGSYPSGLRVNIPEGSDITAPNGVVVHYVGGVYSFIDAGAYRIDLPDGTSISFTVLANTAVPVISLIDGGVYNTNLKVAVSDDLSLKVNGVAVPTGTSEYSFTSEGNYTLEFINGDIDSVVNITIRHSHIWCDNVCMECGVANMDAPVSIGNVVDGESYPVLTTLTVDSGVDVSVNGELVATGSSLYSSGVGSKVVYTFSESGKYTIEMTDGSETKTANIRVKDSNVISFSALVNGAVYPAGTEIRIPKKSTFIVDGVPADPAHNKISLGDSNSIICTKSNGESTLVRVSTHKHKYKKTILVPSSCTTDGSVKYSCSCGSEYITVKKAKGHEMSRYEECITCGYNEYEVGSQSELEKFGYELHRDTNTVDLCKYTGSDKDVVVYGLYNVDGVNYRAYINYPVFAGRDVTSVVFKKGVRARESINQLFSNCSELTYVDFSGLDTSLCTTFSELFSKCTKLVSVDLSSLDTSRVKTLSSMFNECKSLTSVNFSNWDTSSVGSFNAMFYNCTSLETIDISSFDSSSAYSIAYMFYYSTSLRTVYVGDKWNVDSESSSKALDFTKCFKFTSVD